MLHALLLAIVVSVNVSASEWPYPESLRQPAANNEYEFRVAPVTRDKRGKSFGACRGTLYERKDNKLALVWERSLINDFCPNRFCVANSGKYVVTLGEWSHYEDLPIVVYGANGSLVNVYGRLRQLLPRFPSNFMHSGRITDEGIPSEGRFGRNWLRHSLFFFASNDNFFVVRLSNGEILVFETHSGEVIDEQWKDANRIFPEKMRNYEDLTCSLPGLVVKEALRLASSELPKEKEDGQFVLSQCRGHETVRVLKEALSQSISRIVSTPNGQIRQYPGRKAAKEALMAMGEKVPEDVITEEKVETKN